MMPETNDKQAPRQRGQAQASALKAQKFTQQEVNYIELSETPGKACANCRFFNALDNWCTVIENWPEDVLATGYCDFWHAKTKPGEIPVEPLPVVIVGDESKEVEKPAETVAPTMPVAEHKSITTKLFDWFKSVMGEASKEAASGRVSGFKVSADGNAWFAWHTGAAEDLEKEIFPMAAHDSFIDRFDKQLVPRAELWFWHMPIPHGKALWIGREDLVVASAGVFDETPTAERFKAWYREHSDLEVSQGFTFIKALKQDKTYWHYDTFEISPLPPQAKAAYPYTQFNEVVDMSITPEK
ncbi:MAG: hypothetical protein L0Z53_10880, partial [Acidobacteriales bacterium]|nr:hypothetical protein [Terriglobales bacterium]